MLTCNFLSGCTLLMPRSKEKAGNFPTFRVPVRNVQANRGGKPNAANARSAWLRSCFLSTLGPSLAEWGDNKTTCKMNPLKSSFHAVAAVLAVHVLIATPHPVMAGGLMDKQQMLLVDGKPRFILGLYENPKDDALLKEAVAAGFNLFQCAPKASELNRVQQFGAKGWVNVGNDIDLSSDSSARKHRLQEQVSLLANHPALLVWEGPDEILWNTWYGTIQELEKEFQAMSTAAGGAANLNALYHRATDFYHRGLYQEFQKVRCEFWAAVGSADPLVQVRIDDAPERVVKSGKGVAGGIRAIHEVDREHVVWMNHAPRNSLSDLALYNTLADMAGCDIYPAPANRAVGHSDLVDMGLTSVGAYTERMRLAAPGKACAMVLQGFGWGDLKQGEVTDHERAVGIGRRPSRPETRFMAYDAILHGANAILYWGTAYMKPMEDDGSPVTGRPRLWRDLLQVAREIRALEPALVAAPLKQPRIRQSETCGSIDGTGLICTLRRVDDDFVLIVLNEKQAGIRFTVEGLPGKLNDRVLHRLYTAEDRVVAGGRIVDGIASQGVHVYATSKRFEDPVVKADSSR